MLVVVPIVRAFVEPDVNIFVGSDIGTFVSCKVNEFFTEENGTAVSTSFLLLLSVLDRPVMKNHQYF